MIQVTLVRAQKRYMAQFSGLVQGLPGIFVADSKRTYFEGHSHVQEIGKHSFVSGDHRPERLRIDEW